MGGFRVQARTQDQAQELLDDARSLVDAGVYSLVLEGIPSDVAELVTREVPVPTIGIGAGPHTDGQVLVCYDFLGMYRGKSPKFVRRFAELGDSIAEAARSYVSAVREGEFPAPEHGFSMAKGQTLAELGPGARAERGGEASEDFGGYGAEKER